MRALQHDIHQRADKGELSYRVQVGTQDVQVLVDTGAQCSLVREDTARQLGLKVQPVSVREAPRLCGVSGKRLPVQGKTTLTCQQAGQTTTENVWVVRNIQNDVILGIPWLRRHQPAIYWQQRTLVFPSGEEWVPEPARYVHLKTINCIQKHQPADLWVAAVSTIVTSSPKGSPASMPMEPEATQLLQKYAELFEPLDGTPPEQRVQHHIDLEEGAHPVMRRPYRLSATQINDATEQLSKAMQHGWITPSQSPWGMPILMVPKKDNKWHLCVDYRDLNAVTVQDAYPLPRIDDLLHQVGAPTWFTRLDLEAGYHQIWINPTTATRPRSE